MGSLVSCNRRALIVIAHLALLIPLFTTFAFSGENPSTPVEFARDVAPLLVKRCQVCHGPDKAKGKYRLDTLDRLMKPGDGGNPPIVAGDPSKSELYRLISTADEDDRMPKKGERLSDVQVSAIRRWIENGAKVDGAEPSTSLAALAAAAPFPDPPEVYPRPVPITALAFSPDGSELAASGYHEITLWNASDGGLLRRIKGLPQRVQSLAFSPDGRWIAAAGGTPGISGDLRLIDPAGQSAPRVLERSADMVLAVRFSPDGSRLAAGGADNAIRIYDTATARREVLIEQHADWVMDLAFSPDGSRIVSASRDKSCRVFDAKTGAMEAAYLEHEEPVFSVAWSEDGSRVFSTGRDHRLREWNAADAKTVNQVGIDADVFRIEAGLASLFTCASDGVVRQLSPDLRQAPRAFPSMADWVYSLAIDAKGHRVAAGSVNGEVRVWNVEDGREITMFVASPGPGNCPRPPHR